MRRWYAYLHREGSLHVRPYLDSTGAGDVEDARESPYVEAVVGPYDAHDRVRATAYAREEIAAQLAGEET